MNLKNKLNDKILTKKNENLLYKTGDIIYTSNHLSSLGINNYGINNLIKNDKLIKLKNGLYIYKKNEFFEENFLSNGYSLPFLEGKDVYLTGYSLLKIGSPLKNIQFGTIGNVKSYSLGEGNYEINIDIKQKNFKPDYDVLKIQNLEIKIASREQAILDYLDTKNTGTENDFFNFLDTIDKIKEGIDLIKFKNLAVKNGQISSLARFGYIYEHIFGINKNEFIEWKYIVQNNIKHRVKLDYSFDENKGTFTDDWKIINNHFNNEIISDKRNFGNIPSDYIKKRNSILNNIFINYFGNNSYDMSILSLENRKNLIDLLMYESYFNNLVEGTIFTLEEMLEILKNGNASNIKKPIEDIYDIKKYFEIYNDFLNGSLNLKDMSILEKICYINKRLCSHKFPEDSDKPAGIFRSDVKKPYQVYVGNFLPPEPNLLKNISLYFEEEYNNIKNPFVKAIFVHFFVAEMHPFPDGNGRTSRLMQNLILLEHGFLPIMCTPQNKKYIYKKGLKDMSFDNNFESFEKYIKVGYGIAKNIFNEKSIVNRLYSIKNEFEVEDSEILRGTIDIAKILSEYYKDKKEIN